ncbi:hypothetical protein [Rathayibacter sp. AY1C5]|uniref:hypothetical protein n=1 Tax=Rathayibacter sp. AY1C5 TaxID=2080538 RepID=UPI0011B00558|nr:hypothetical protein [Rathayibacter sp. AY1C5]
MAVDYRETLVTYLRSDDLDSAAKSLGLTRAALAARIKVLKTAGVKVPKLRRSGGLTSFDVAQLNSLVRKYEADKKQAT